jgi:hypothetical protein
VLRDESGPFFYFLIDLRNFVKEQIIVAGTRLKVNTDGFEKSKKEIFPMNFHSVFSFILHIF